jgi:hypothetical protein
MGLGHSHFLISVVLPGGGTLSGFCPQIAAVARGAARIRWRNEQVRRPRHDPTLPEVHLTLRLRSGAAKADHVTALHWRQSRSCWLASNNGAKCYSIAKTVNSIALKTTTISQTIESQKIKLTRSMNSPSLDRRSV